MEKIDSIRIMQVDGLNSGSGAAAVADGAGNGTNLAEQAVGAALRYRAYAPVLDKLLKEVGLSEHGIAGLVPAAQPGVSVNSPDKISSERGSPQSVKGT
jgi:uncharacterized membrane protein YqiK